MSLARRRRVSKQGAPLGSVGGPRASAARPPDEPTAATYSFHCTACGKCCNSGPQLSLPELFHHERRFIGCLTLRRVRSLRSGDALGTSGDAQVSADDERAFEQLAERLLHPLPSAAGAPHQRLLLATQALYEVDQPRCPLLAADNACSLQYDRKPLACAVAPLEAFLPDRLQHHVLAGRRQAAEYHGTDCIQPGASSVAERVITRRLTVVQTAARDALARRRADLTLDKQFWGDAVFATLQGPLLSDPAALARIPLEGFVSIPPAPILFVLAAVSERCRLRCLRFVDAQLALLEDRLHMPVTAARPELEALARTARSARTVLSQARSAEAEHHHARQTEAWLGL
ncbi:MAG: hypothetical protein JWN48_1653 [Myxococcaceae bacterium]|nr:hypothetical protein [Myxococcaceae bacterium]